jgi:hypothetical protein
MRSAAHAINSVLLRMMVLLERCVAQSAVSILNVPAL